jgi:hypothetical protein
MLRGSTKGREDLGATLSGPPPGKKEKKEQRGLVGKDEPARNGDPQRETNGIFWTPKGREQEKSTMHGEPFY